VNPYFRKLNTDYRNSSAVFASGFLNRTNSADLKNPKGSALTSPNSNLDTRQCMLFSEHNPCVERTF